MAACKPFTGVGRTCGFEHWQIEFVSQPTWLLTTAGPNGNTVPVETRVRLCTMVGGLPEYPCDIRGSAIRDEERPGAGRYGLVRGKCLCVAVA